MKKQHECPAKLPLSRLIKVATDTVPLEGYGAALVTPQERYIYTDGSGGHHHNQGAGWAAAVFGHLPTCYVLPDYLLFGPVVTNRWDPNFLGAERGTNNTGELTAIGEACLWLLEIRGTIWRPEQPSRAYGGTHLHLLRFRIAASEC